jgi:hypothetical protein
MTDETSIVYGLTAVKAVFIEVALQTYKICYLLYAGFFLTFFGPEDGGGMFFRSVG